MIKQVWDIKAKEGPCHHGQHSKKVLGVQLTLSRYPTSYPTSISHQSPALKQKKEPRMPLAIRGYKEKNSNTPYVTHNPCLKAKR